MRDRLHWIILRGTLLLLCAGGLLAIPLGVFQALRTDEVFWTGDVGYTTELDNHLLRTTPHASATWNGELGVAVSHTSWQLRLSSALPDLLLALAIGYVAGVLLLMVMNIQEGRPFAGRSAIALRSAAVVVAVAAIAVPVSRAWANELILNRALVLEDGEHVGFRLDVNQIIAWLLVSLLVLAAARAFASGSRLAEDVEGLV